MTEDQFISDLQNAYNKMIDNLNMAMNGFVADMVAQITVRVQQNATPAEGAFEQYSTNPSYFPVNSNDYRKLRRPYGKKNESGNQYSVFQSGKKEGQPHTTKYFENGYLGLKIEVGKYVGGRNFNLSGDMWKGFGIKNISKVLNSGVIAEIGGTNEYSQEMINVNTERSGDFTAPNKEEIAIFDAKLNELINEALR